MCQLIYKEGQLKMKPKTKVAAKEAIFEDKEMSMEFSFCRFDEIMEEIGFYVYDYNDFSAILKYHAYPEETHYGFEKILGLIAPFVECGSYMEFADNKGNLKRYVFDGENMIRQEPQITWPELPGMQKSNFVA